jgi:hypothetical protein
VKCPYCSYEFPVTWGRYLRAGFGRYLCPSCGKESKLGKSKKYRLVVHLPLGIVCAIVTVVLWLSTSGSWVTVPVAICVCLAIGIPVDRYVEEKLRQLQPLEKRVGEGPYEETASDSASDAN